ncbi:CopD family protein [Streptomyces mirabilis]|uniref:CopD family protein n=1 Tax=Streptomyces mirabilis TaxID=68239 RepID=UPI00368B470D
MTPFATPRPRRRATALALLLGAVLGLLLAGAGPASAHAKVSATDPAEAAVLKRVPPEALARFSRLAFAAVAVLAATGLYQSWRLVGSWDALVSTGYGKLLLLKTAAVVAMLAVAGAGRPGEGAHDARTATAPARDTGSSGDDVEGSLLTRSGTESPRTDTEEPGTGAGEAGPAGRLRCSVAVEAALAVVVLGITTGLTDTTPGRTDTAAATPAPAAAPAYPTGVSLMVPFDTGGRNGTGKVLVSLGPASVGRNQVQAVAYAFDNGFASVPELRITFTSTEHGIGPLDAHLKDMGGYWETGNLQLPAAGRWKMAVTVRTSDTDQATATRTVTVR